MERNNAENNVEYLMTDEIMLPNTVFVILVVENRDGVEEQNIVAHIRFIKYVEIKSMVKMKE